MSRSQLSSGARSSVLSWISVSLLLVASAVIVQSPFSLSDGKSLTKVNGRISQELLEILSSEKGAEVRLGSRQSDEIDSGGEFEINGRTGAVGLLSASSGGKDIGWSVVPKNANLAQPQVAISVESTALSLVLMTPGIATNSPIGVQALAEVIPTYESYNSLVASLRSELKTEGSLYLEELTPRTTNHLAKTVESVIRGNNKGSYGKLRLSTVASALSQADNCDTGIDSEYGDSIDNVCVDLLSGIPNTGRPDELKFQFTNRSSRWVFVIKETENQSPDVIGVVPPRKWAFPSLPTQILGVIDKLTANGQETLNVEVLTEGTETLSVEDFDNSHLLTVTFGNSKSTSFDAQVNQLQKRWLQQLSIGLTTITEFIIPIIEIVLDQIGAGGSDFQDKKCSSASVTKSLIYEVLKSDEVIGKATELGVGVFDSPIKMIASVLSDEFMWSIFGTIVKGALLDECNDNSEALLKTLGQMQLCPPVSAISYSSNEELIERTKCEKTNRTDLIMSLINRYVLKEKLAGELAKTLLPGQAAYRAYIAAPGLQSLALRSADLYVDIGKFGTGDSYSVESVFASRFCGNVRTAIRPYSDLSIDSSAPPLRKLLDLGFLFGNTTKIGSSSFFSSQVSAWTAVMMSAPDSVKSDAELIAGNIEKMNTVFEQNGPQGRNIFSANNQARIRRTLEKLEEIVADSEDPMNNLIRYYQENCRP